MIISDPSTPNAQEVQRILSELEDGMLAPYVLPHNMLSRNLYVDLPLPWLNPATADAFVQDAFLRKEWDVNGILTHGDDFFGGSKMQTLENLAQGLGSASMVTRWRSTHEDLAGTDQDCVTLTMRRLREALGRGSAGGDDATLRTGMGTVILMLKRA